MNAPILPEADSPATPSTGKRAFLASAFRFFRPPPDEGRETPALPAHVAEAESNWEKTLDTLVWAGYNALRSHQKDVASSVDRLRDADILRIRNGVARQGLSLQAEIEALRDRRRLTPREEAGVQIALQENERERQAALAQVGESRAAVWLAYARLVPERARYAVRTLTERASAEADLASHAARETAAADAARIDAEIRMAAGEWFRRAASQPELDARVQEKQAQLTRARLWLERQGQRAESARSSGLNAAVAGFLVWAGYLGMAAFGWMFSEALQMPADANGNRAGFVRFLIQASYDTFLEVGPARALWWVAAFAVLWVVVAPGLFWCYDRILTRFDRGWNPDDDAEGGDKQRGKQGRPQSGRRRAFDLSWDTILSTLAGNVERSEYRRHLARTPLLATPVLLGLLALAFFSIRQAPLGDFHDSLNSLMYLVVGIATAAGATGFACIVITRCLRLKEERGEVPRWVGWLLVSAPAVVAVLFVTLALDWIQGREASLAGATLLLIGNAGVLGFGLVYRNMYREGHRLRDEVARLDAELARLKPHTLKGAADLYPQSLAQRWDSLGTELDAAWAEQDEDAAKLIDSPDGDHAGSAFWRDPVLRTTAVAARDLRLAPSESLEVTKSRAAYMLGLRRLKAATRMRSALLERRAQLVGGELMQKISDLERQLCTIEDEGAAAVCEAEVRYSTLRMDIEMAYRTGEALRSKLDHLHSDPLLASHAGGAV